jgi:hypothetical protein
MIVDDGCFIRRIGELAEAAMHAGRTSEARALLAECETRALHSPCPRLHTALMYARPYCR